jgi:urease accessory protein
LQQALVETWSKMASKNLSRSSIELSPWRAELQLRADCPNNKTRVRRTHAQGPLQIQKVLYPEGDSIAHVFILHPPSGIAHDDQLDIQILASGQSHSVIATPGATRWYKSGPNAQGPSHQSVTLTLSDQSRLEWLPYENLYYDQTWASNRLEIRLDPTCRMIGWDMHQFGRVSCGEPWQSGRARNELFFYLQGELFWTESANWTSEHTNDARDQHQLAGHSFIGSLWAYGPSLNDDDHEFLAGRLSAEEGCLAAVSQLKAPTSYGLEPGDTNHTLQSPYSLILMRVLTNEPQRARAICEWTRDFLRPRVMSVPASNLRIWAT